MRKIEIELHERNIGSVYYAMEGHYFTWVSWKSHYGIVAVRIFNLLKTGVVALFSFYL
ncbi:hypothetical protein ACJX0J_019226, partial [Zea mays]